MKSHGLAVRMMGLANLLDAVDTGSVALPDFQRDFEWSSADVEQMLVTALNAWPAGSLLLLESGGELFFKLKPFHRGPVKLASQPKFIVLDGQQRITALYHAIYDKGDRIYYLDCDALVQERDLEEAVRALSRGKWEALYGDAESQARGFVVPCAALKSPTSFFEWRDMIVDAAGSKSLSLRKDLTAIYQDYIAPIHSYEFPAVVLEASTNPPAVARIFERVNRLGMRLNTFDLMVARTYATNWNLRDSWKLVGVDFPRAYAFFESDGLSSLQVISLRAVDDVRQAAVLKLQPALVHKEWERAAEGLAAAAAYFQQELFANSRSELPYAALSILVAALAAEGYELGKVDRLDAFLWAKSFGRAYDVASNTRIVADYKRIKRADGITEKLCATDLTLEDLVFAGRQGGKALMNSLTLYCRKQWGRAEGLGATELASVPLFSPAHESVAVGVPDLHSRVMGTLVVPLADAQQIRRHGFEVWLREAGFHREDVLEKNFLPPAKEIFRSLEHQELEELLVMRSMRLLDSLGSIGVQVTTVEER